MTQKACTCEYTCSWATLCASYVCGSASLLQCDQCLQQPPRLLAVGVTQDYGRPLEPVHPRPDQLQQGEVGGEHQRREREVGAGAIVYEGGVEAKGAGAAYRDG